MSTLASQGDNAFISACKSAVGSIGGYKSNGVDLDEPIWE